MPKTYYDSELTEAQIENALEAIHGVVTPSNNGKVLYIEDGQIKAASASRWSGGAVLEPLSVTQNGDYTPPSGTDGFDSVHVAVPSATLTTKSITQNGTYNASQDNADGYSSVTVDVQGGSSAVVQPLSVTQNGTYNPPSGIDGYAPVTVNVSGGGIPSLPAEYQQVEYISCAGSQWTLVPMPSNALVQVRAMQTQTKNEQSVFGYNSGSSDSKDFEFEFINTNELKLWVRNSVYGQTLLSQDTASASQPKRLLVRLSNQRTSAYIGSYNGLPTSSIHFTGNVYEVRIYDFVWDYTDATAGAITMVHDYVPCYRVADNKPGFFDVIGNVFYTNISGVDDFGVGPDVN